jgi:hypothetical protein
MADKSLLVGKQHASLVKNKKANPKGFAVQSDQNGMVDRCKRLAQVWPVCRSI